MANQQFQRTPGKGKFAYMGINTHRAPDLMPEGRAPFLLNVSPDQTQGAMNPRAALSLIGPVTGLPHSARRINDNLPGATNAWTRLIGSGTSLYGGESTFAAIDTGYSGNPMSIIPYRPPQTPETWAYVYDSAKQQKYKTDNTTKANIGIMPPTVAPVTELNPMLIKPLLDVSSITGWVGSGGATTPTLSTRVPASTTVAAILYDSGTTGWASVVPVNSAVSYGWLGIGARFTIDSEISTCVQTFTPMSATTVAGVAYDSGTSGLATIMATVPVQGMVRNTLVLIGSTYVRVLSVSSGPDGLYSFRAVLPSGIAAGNALSFPPSFRIYLTATHAAGAAITSPALLTSLTLTGSLTSNALLANTSISPIDLTFIGTRPITDEDYLYFSVQLGNPANVTEIHLLLDVDSTTNDFNHNYYYYILRQNDFQATAVGAATSPATLLSALSNQIADSYTFTDSGQGSPPVSDELDPGNAQWFDAMIKTNDLVRVGSDPTVGLNAIKAIGILAIVTGSSTMEMGAIWVGGTYGPDANFNSYGNQGTEMLYRFRYRSLATGAMSELSPATRSGDLPMRNGINVTVTASTDPQVDTIDIERNGGTQDTWHRCMIVPNTTGTYLDVATENFVAASDPLELLQYAPWPITDKPRSGVCNIVGTSVTWVSGDTFNTSWIRGVEFIVNNQTYTLHGPPTSATRLDIEENIGVLTNVAFQIPEATIIGYPLPYVCGPFEGRFFATGDPYNPGNLYFSQPYNPDSAADKDYIEVTGPGEPLLPPVVFEGAVYARSADSVFRVDSTPGQANPYTGTRLGGMVGLAATWATSAEGPVLAWLGLDGIYVMAGQGAGQNITREDLSPLFPFESRPGLPVSVNGYTLYPPDYSQQTRLRLSYADGFLLFNYLDTQGTQRTLAINLATKGAIPYVYSPGVTLHYQEEGVSNPVTLALGLDGTVNDLSAQLTDNGVAFTCVVVTPSDDQGETRARKQYGDVMLDYAGQPTLAVYYDNFLLASITSVQAGAGSRTQAFTDLGLDTASLHRNIGLAVTWRSNSGTVLNEWQPSFLLKPEDTVDRPTDWLDAGTIGNKFVHGCRITADTGGVPRTVQIQYDGGIIGPVLAVNHAGEVTLPYSFPPFRAHMMRLVPLDSATWRLMAVEWDVDPEPEATGYWVTQTTSFDLPGYMHMRDMQFAYATTQVGAVLTVLVDGRLYTLSASLAATAGNEIKKYLVSPPIKGKIWQLYATGTALKIYQRDCEFRMKPWGADNYVTLKPFGDLSGAEARI